MFSSKFIPGDGIIRPDSADIINPNICGNEESDEKDSGSPEMPSKRIQQTIPEPRIVYSPSTDDEAGLLENENAMQSAITLLTSLVDEPGGEELYLAALELQQALLESESSGSGGEREQMGNALQCLASAMTSPLSKQQKIESIKQFRAQTVPFFEPSLEYKILRHLVAAVVSAALGFVAGLALGLSFLTAGVVAAPLGGLIGMGMSFFLGFDNKAANVADQAAALVDQNRRRF